MPIPWPVVIGCQYAILIRLLPSYLILLVWVFSNILAAWSENLVYTGCIWSGVRLVPHTLFRIFASHLLGVSCVTEIFLGIEFLIISVMFSLNYFDIITLYEVICSICII